MADIERLGTNKGFELGDVTQFSTTDSVKLVSFVASTEANAIHAGSYGGLARTAATDVDYGEAATVNQQVVVITTDPVYCASGIVVTGSFWQRIYQDSLPEGGHWGTRTMAATLDFYTSGDELISSESIATGFPTSTYGQKTGSATAPATTNKVKLKVTYTMPCYTDEGYNDVTIGMYTAVDDFSITIPGAVARAMVIG